MLSESYDSSYLIKRTSFWDTLEDGGTATALIWNGTKISYQELAERSDEIAQYMVSSTKMGSLGFLLVRNDCQSVLCYLAALRCSCPLLLLPSDISDDALNLLLNTYKPMWIATSETRNIEDYDVPIRTHQSPYILGNKHSMPSTWHISLKLLLSTSGTTGSPKLVRLSGDNIQSNAQSICQYLNIVPSSCAITSLPLSYSYGLSVLNSHLNAKASIVLTDQSIMNAGFWQLVNAYKVTNFAGVPYSYQMLSRLKHFETSTIRCFTQAGGRLPNSLILKLNSLALNCGKQFIIMYGQTEASPRISYVPFDRLSQKIGSIGIPIPGGTLKINSEANELVYQGPNVMLGYAESIADLSRGDDLLGVLNTGDVGLVDDEGYFWITGRLKRFLKIFGNRINLDDLERILERQFELTTAVAGNDQKIIVVFEQASAEIVQNCAAFIVHQFGIHHSALRILSIDQMPRTPNNKFDYQTLNMLL